MATSSTTTNFPIQNAHEPRDYTRWRETHCPGEGEDIRELGGKIMAHAAAARNPAPALATVG